MMKADAQTVQCSPQTRKTVPLCMHTYLINVHLNTLCELLCEYMVRETSLGIRLKFSVEKSETQMLESLLSTTRTFTQPLESRKAWLFPQGSLQIRHFPPQWKWELGLPTSSI